MENGSTHVPHILELTSKAKKDFLDSFNAIFFDCDGVIWLVVGTIPHTNEAVNLLKDAGKSCKFVSNNSVRSESEYLELFQKIGVRNVVADDIIHPARSMLSYMKTHYSKDDRIFSICSRTANELFRKNDLNIDTLDTKEFYTPSSVLETMRSHKGTVKAVLFDINLDMNFIKLACAYQYLKQEDCNLIVGGMDPFIPMAPDITVIGSAPFMQILRESQSKKEPIILGKPGFALGELMKETFNIVDPHRCLFVGDSLDTDIAFGKQCGFQTLFVLTGIHTKEDVLAAPIEKRPDFYADGLTDFIEFFKDLTKENDDKNQ